MAKLHFYGCEVPNKRALLKFARKVAGKISKIPKQGEVSVIFTSDSKIKKINKSFLRTNSPTDVITFNYNSSPDRLIDVPFGDIYISVDTAKRQARMGGHTLTQELALLLLHGLLHLAGYEDRSPQKKRVMFHQQKLLFKRVAPHLAPPDMV